MVHDVSGSSSDGSEDGSEDGSSEPESRSEGSSASGPSVAQSGSGSSSADPYEGLDDDELRALWTRVNVSGDLNLCGAFALQGLIFTHCGPIVMPLDVLLYQLRAISAGSIEPQLDNFGFDIIRDVAWRYYGISLELYVEGPHPSHIPSIRGEDATIGTLYLIQSAYGLGHYNYLGLPMFGPEEHERAQLFLASMEERDL
jgi:hypothetical protein